jgi:sugar O-acyltransferase (sialic acid O-acetyltransferase NeuD family)
MRDLIIYGAGGFGRETALMIRQINDAGACWNVLGFFDDNLRKDEFIYGLPVLGNMSDLNRFPTTVSVAIAIADPHVRKRIRDGIQNPRVDFPALVHPAAALGDLHKDDIGEGSIIAAGNIFTTDILIEPFVIINLSCTIGHDTLIKEFCSVMPGCSISGSVTLGSFVQVGTGARILPGISIGKTSRVGAGAVVTKNVGDDVTVVGVPARVVGKNDEFRISNDE